MMKKIILFAISFFVSIFYFKLLFQISNSFISSDSAILFFFGGVFVYLAILFILKYFIQGDNNANANSVLTGAFSGIGGIILFFVLIFLFFAFVFTSVD